MFTIGEFSRLACISARMLRHYDHIGLLQPEKIDDMNGYRYYTLSQLKKIQKIEKLKEYEFQLSQIRELLNLSDDELDEKLKCQYQNLIKQKDHYDQLIHQMEQELFHKEKSIMNNYHVITMTMKAQNVLTVQRCIEVNETSFHQLADELYKKMKEQNLTQIGPLQISYLDEEFNMDHATVEMQVEVNETGKDVKVIPERLCVTVVHIGTMKKISQAYEAIMTWLSMHEEYQISGPCIERLLKDEEMAKCEDKMETAVIFPIELRDRN